MKNTQLNTQNRDSEFHAWRIKKMIGLSILCGLAIPIGLIMKIPAVWILGILGLLVAEMKLLHFLSTSKGVILNPEARAPGWRIRCLKCGFTEPWGKYGVRLWATGKEYTLGWCSRCRWLRFQVIEKTKTESADNPGSTDADNGKGSA